MRWQCDTSMFVSCRQSLGRFSLSPSTPCSETKFAALTYCSKKKNISEMLCQRSFLFAPMPCSELPRWGGRLFSSLHNGAFLALVVELVVGRFGPLAFHLTRFSDFAAVLLRRARLSIEFGRGRFDRLLSSGDFGGFHFGRHFTNYLVDWLIDWLIERWKK